MTSTNVSLTDKELYILIIEIEGLNSSHPFHDNKNLLNKLKRAYTKLR